MQTLVFMESRFFRQHWFRICSFAKRYGNFYEFISCNGFVKKFKKVTEGLFHDYVNKETNWRCIFTHKRNVLHVKLFVIDR